MEGFNADSGSLALYQQGEDGNCLRIVAGLGLPADCIGNVVPTGNSVIGWVLEHKQALLLEGNVNNDPRFHRHIPKSDTQIPCTALCWPLLTGQQLSGVLCINRFDERQNYTEADLDRGKLLVKLITLVIDNIRLHSDQNTRIQQLAETKDRYTESNRQLKEAQARLVESENRLFGILDSLDSNTYCYCD